MSHGEKMSNVARTTFSNDELATLNRKRGLRRGLPHRTTASINRAFVMGGTDRARITEFKGNATDETVTLQ